MPGWTRGGRELLLESIQNLAKVQPDMGLVLVTHHIEEIMPVFENILVLSEGRIIDNGPANEIICSQLIRRLYGVSTTIRRSAGRFWMIRD